MLMITLTMLYVHVIIFYVQWNDDELDVMRLHYLIMFHGYLLNDVDDYSLFNPQFDVVLIWVTYSSHLEHA